ncbi:MAG: 4Fe-4S binding protein [Clostridia bacterium]|nr:4Fe-4S binding protein [Clostridia bacterium]
MKKQKSMKVFTVLRYVSLGAILGYMVAEAVIHGFINRYAEVPAFHALCPFEAFGRFLNTITGLEFFSDPFASASVFFLFLILMAILLNRVFCGFLCAFGALQEFIGNLGAKVLKKRPTIPAKVDKALRTLKYVFLVLSVLLAYFTGIEFFRSFLGLAQGSDAFAYIDPWIAFKSILSNNLIVGGYIASFVVLVISLVGSFFFQRFYCKYACPLGALYAVFGSLSGLHVFRNVKPECEDCALQSAPDALVDESVTPIDSEEAEELEEIDERENTEEAVEIDYCNDEYDEGDETFDDEDYQEYDVEPETDGRNESGDSYCVNCGKCSEACPMGIDVASVNGRMDFAECIACQRCVAACPKKGALQTKYFKAKSHPIIIMLITFVVFFGGVFALNFIKIDRGGPAKEPIYDSVRIAPEAPSDGSFSVKQLMDATGKTFDEIKAEYHLNDSVTEKSTYAEFSNGMTLAYFKENSVDEYDEIIRFFGLSSDDTLGKSLGEVLDAAPISVSAEYLGFDPEKIGDFAAYFGASPDDKFATISKRYFEIYDEYYKYINTNADEWNAYIAQYGSWYECSYGAKGQPVKNFYELSTECVYEKDLAQYLTAGRFTVQWMLQQDGTTLSEFKETYHLDDNVNLRSSYSDFYNAIKLSFYKETFAKEAEETGVDSFPEMIAIYGYTPETIDLEMTLGKLLDSGTVEQAARFMGCETDAEVANFAEQYEAASADVPFADIHANYNKAMDDYYNMLYQYYSGEAYY